MKARAPALVVLLALSGCGTDSADVPLGGRWTGSIDGGIDGTVSFVWELRESEGVIAGTASATSGPLTLTGDVSGSYIHPDVRMTMVVRLEPPDEFEYRWVGTRTGDDALNGVLSDSDGDSGAFDLTRE